MPKKKMTPTEIKDCTDMQQAYLHDMAAQRASFVRQIGSYEENPGLTPENKATIFTSAFKQALCPAPTETQTAREAFLHYLCSEQAMKQHLGFTRDYRNQCIAQGKAGDATLKIDELIGKDGLALYQAALEEECASSAFMEATVRNNAFVHKGARFKKAGNVFVFGGASGTGKTFSREPFIDDAAQTLERTSDTGNLMIPADGGDARDTSQMRKMMIQFALLKNCTGVSDIHKKSEGALGPVKHRIETATQANSEHLNLFVPATLSKEVGEALKSKLRGHEFKTKQQALDWVHDEEAKHKGVIEELHEKMPPGARILYGRITSDDSSFKNTVEYRGKARAWLGDTTQNFNVEGMSLNCTGLPESKAYSAGTLGSSFYAGDIASEYAESKLLDVRVVHYDLALYKETKLGNNDWQKLNSASVGVPGVESFSKRMYTDWEKSHTGVDGKKVSLTAFNKQWEGPIPIANGVANLG